MYASNAARFEQSVRNTLDQLKVRGRKDTRANIFQLLHDWLCDGRSRPWLIVLDNADDARVLLGKRSVCEQGGGTATSGLHEKALLEYLPQCGHGRILVTSRSREAAKELVEWKDMVAVEPMETEQALALLEKKLDQAYDVRNVVALAHALDFMPLAMVQAAAYICQRAGRCSVQEYLEKLGQCDRSEESVLDIDERNLRRDREANNSIMLTWQISFSHIREVRPSASDLLSLMSFFDRQAIPEELLQERGSSQAEAEEECSTVDSKASERGGEDAGTHALSERNTGVPVDKAEEYEEDIVVLRNYNLVSSTADRTIFEMHRLVQVATKKWLKAAKQYDRWSSQFMSNLEDTFPTSDFDNWAICQSFFPHTIVALHMEVTGQKTVLRQASLLFRSGNYASAVGSYADAEKMEERSVESRRNVLGAGHPSTLTSMSNLAGTYSDQGRLEEAEKVQVEVLEKMKEVLGAGHPDTLTSMNNLARTYSRQGRLGEAEEVQVEVLEKSKEVLGAGHPSTLTSMKNLATTYSRQGRLEEAEKVQVEVMEKSKELL
jgi:tetratricopeptide (TPR) repeat protein